MDGPLARLPEQARRRLVAAPRPSWVEPMLATLTAERFSDPAWFFEPKFDGERCIAIRDGGEVRLLSRNRKRLDGHYPELVAALAAQEADDFAVDGEIVAFDGDRTSFSRLQRRMQLEHPSPALRADVPIFYYLFDMVYANGYDLTRLGCRDRKAALAGLLSLADPLRPTSHRDTEGEAAWREACARGWEGVIAKRADGPYVHGRSHDWLKFKCVNEQEFVIAGFTDPKGSRVGFGALLVGYYDGDDLVYAGKVGTGFDDELLRTLRHRLDALEQDRPPFTVGRPPAAGTHWVRPELVAQLGFAEWTVDGRLRHPRLLGLRDDKDPRSVRRERAV